MKARAPLSAKGRAGQALVEEVVLGVLDSVSCITLALSERSSKLT